jgi:hypothetical protein
LNRRAMLNLALPIGMLQRPAVRDHLARADVVLGYDLASGNLVPFFGRRLLAEARAVGGSTVHARLAIFQYDSRTRQLEFLFAAVEAVKGAGTCSYEGSGTFAFTGGPDEKGGSDGEPVEAET